MSATATPATADRSDFRTVMVGGTQIGVLTAAAVVAFLAVSQHVPALVPQSLLEALIVLTAGIAVSLLPGRLTEGHRGRRRHRVVGNGRFHGDRHRAVAAVQGLSLDLGRRRRREHVVVLADLVDARDRSRLDRGDRHSRSGCARRPGARPRRHPDCRRRSAARGGCAAGRPPRGAAGRDRRGLHDNAGSAGRLGARPQAVGPATGEGTATCPVGSRICSSS